jgi:hypothetical protein
VVSVIAAVLELAIVLGTTIAVSFYGIGLAALWSSEELRRQVNRYPLWLQALAPALIPVAAAVARIAPRPVPLDDATASRGPDRGGPDQEES